MEEENTAKHQWGEHERALDNMIDNAISYMQKTCSDCLNFSHRALWHNCHTWAIITTRSSRVDLSSVRTQVPRAVADCVYRYLFQSQIVVILKHF